MAKPPPVLFRREESWQQHFKALRDEIEYQLRPFKAGDVRVAVDDDLFGGRNVFVHCSSVPIVHAIISVNDREMLDLTPAEIGTIIGSSAGKEFRRIHIPAPANIILGEN